MFALRILRLKPLPFFRKYQSIAKDRLRDKVAIVTASTKGIGFSIAERLAKEGAKVIISSRKQEHVNEALRVFESQNLNVTGLVCHVSKDEDRKKLLNEANKLGGVDILVSNAAINPSPALILESSVEVWDKIFDVNLRSSYLLSKEVVPVFKSKGGGNIVYISSYVAYQPSAIPIGSLGIYSISKTALLGLTKALAFELARDNIRVNCVCPGSIKTNFGNYVIEKKDFAEVVLGSIPMRRFGEPDEVSGAVAFLVGDDSSYITGESITVAGGGPSRL